MVKTDKTIDLGGINIFLNKYAHKFLTKFSFLILFSSFLIFGLNKKENRLLLFMILTIFVYILFIVTYYEERLFFAKIVPILSLASFNYILFLKKALSRKIKMVVILVSFFLVVVSNTIFLFQIKYYVWAPNIIDYHILESMGFDETEVNTFTCSNYDPFIIYYTKFENRPMNLEALLITATEFKGLEDSIKEIKNIGLCRFIYYFDYLPHSNLNIKGKVFDFDTVNSVLMNNFELMNITYLGKNRQFPVFIYYSNRTIEN